MNKDDIKKEARILSTVANLIASGSVEPNEEQLKMIIAINDEFYRPAIAKMRRERENRENSEER